MARNWGMQKTSGTDLRGVEHRSRSHSRDTQRDLNSVGVLPNSRSQEGESFIDPFELGSCALFFFVVLLPFALVGSAALGYAAFVLQAVEN